VALAEDLCNNFKVTGYLKSRVESLTVELNFIFKTKESQPTLLDFL
jgi:DNA polymerase II large subunit